MGRPTCVKRIYIEVPNTEYTVFTMISEDYEYKTVVDTKFVKYLELFKWFKINTDDGIYFGSINTNESNRGCITKLELPFEYGKQLLLHRLIAYLAQLENPNNHTSVDHINRQTLDNRSKNLRWLSQSNQNRNTDKRQRKYNAQKLPDDIELPLPKYITWNLNREKTSGENILERRFFRVEKHPAQEKAWTSSKSSKFSNQEKLDCAKKELERLNTLINPEPDKILRDQLLKEYNELITI